MSNLPILWQKYFDKIITLVPDKLLNSMPLSDPRKNGNEGLAVEMMSWPQRLDDADY
jgi:hypothetical protein